MKMMALVSILIFSFSLRGVLAEEVPQIVTSGEAAKPYGITGESLITLIKEMVGLKEDSSIVYHRATGQLFIKAAPAHHKLIETLLGALRNYKTRQVIIEARFIELRDFEGIDIGYELRNIEFRMKKADLGVDFKTTSGQTSAVDFATGTFGKFATTATPALNLFTTFDTRNLDINSVIRALSQKVRVDTLSAPKITCFNNQRANIKVTTSTNYVKEVSGEAVATTSGTTTTVTITVATAVEGVSLDVTPTYNETMQMITLELHPAVVSVDLSSTQSVETSSSVSNSVTLPVFTNQTIDTTVTIPDGGTIVLGGLITEKARKDTRKVPLLGDIPIIKHFFRYKTEYMDRTNLLIFITAKAM